MKLTRDPVEKRYRLQYLDDDGGWHFLASKLATSAAEAMEDAARRYGLPRNHVRLEPRR